jgi:protease PrsW
VSELSAPLPAGTQWLRHRIPLLVVVGVIVATSTPAFLTLVWQDMAPHAAPAALALAVWCLYALPLLWLITTMDYFEREPWSTIAGALAWGALVATGMVPQVNSDLRSMVGAVLGLRLAEGWSAALAGPITEEPAKLLGVIVVILLARRRIRTPLDGLIIGAVVGLGFQVAEDFVYTLRAMPLMGPWGAIPAMAWTRGVIAGLWSHAAYTAIAGYGIGYAVVRNKRPAVVRIGVVTLCLLAAIALHALWNSPIATTQLGTSGHIIKGLTTLVFFVAVLAAGQRRDAAFFLPYLRLAPNGPMIASAEELAALPTFASRLSARWRATRAAGLHAGHQTAALQRGQADAACAIARDDARALTLARGAILRSRTNLRRLASAGDPPT